MPVHVLIDHNFWVRNNAGSKDKEGSIESLRSKVCEELVSIEALLCGDRLIERFN